MLRRAVVLPAFVPWPWALLLAAGCVSDTSLTKSGAEESLNLAPSVSVVLTPTEAYTDTTLTATATASDPEGDGVRLEYTWYVDGVLVAAGTDHTLSGVGAFDRDQVVSVTVTASDAAGSGTGTSNPVLILDSAPSAPALAFLPEIPVEGEPLRCLIATPSSDPDADPITYTFAWTLQGEPFLEGADLMVASVVDGAAVGGDATWTCTATPSDGTLEGPAATIETTNACGSWWYIDHDGDGYGEPDSGTWACEAPAGATADDTDCDDENPNIYPGAPEVCDGSDDDCDGVLSRMEGDPDGDGWFACEEAAWLENGDTVHNDPTTGGEYGASHAAGLLATAGQQFTFGGTMEDVTVDEEWLDEYGILMLAGAATFAFDAAESAAIDAWVADGGGVVYVGFIPGPEQCDSVNSLPAAFGVSCPDRADLDYWTGSATTIVAHPITVGVSSVVGVGGPLWAVSAPSVSVVSQGTAAVVTAADSGAGHAVYISDDWVTYDSYASQGNNDELVLNIWSWLGDHSLE